MNKIKNYIKCFLCACLTSSSKNGKTCKDCEPEYKAIKNYDNLIKNCGVDND